MFLALRGQGILCFFAWFLRLTDPVKCHGIPRKEILYVSF